jgi:hypothetical protein
MSSESAPNKISADQRAKRSANQRPNGSANQRPIAGSALLVAGDALSFLAFAAIGRRSHSENGAIVDVALTAAPFLAAWLASAVLFGALRGELLHSPRRLLTRTLLAWLLAWPLGLGLRALLLQREIPASFAIVVGIANTVLLLGWRGVAAWLVSRRATPAG